MEKTHLENVQKITDLMYTNGQICEKISREKIGKVCLKTMIVILRGKEEYYNSLEEFDQKSGITRKELKAMSRGTYIIKDDKEFVMLFEFKINPEEIAKGLNETREDIKQVVRNHKNKLKLAREEERILSK